MGRSKHFLLLAVSSETRMISKFGNPHVWQYESESHMWVSLNATCGNAKGLTLSLCMAEAVEWHRECPPMTLFHQGGYRGNHVLV